MFCYERDIFSLSLSLSLPILKLLLFKYSTLLQDILDELINIDNLFLYTSDLSYDVIVN